MRKVANTQKSGAGLVRIWSALLFSLEGLRAAFRHEAAFRQELALACLLVPAALLLAVNGASKALLIGSVLLVLIVELLNSALEATLDRISLEDHAIAKRAKDIGSAAVFLSLVNLAVTWLLLLFG